MTDHHPLGVAASRPLVGSLGQLARIDQFVVTGGPANGTRVIRVVNGGGLELEIHPDRAFDIGRVTFRGIPVAWMSPTGMVAPGLVDGEGFGWLKSFGGGLLTTGGLDAIGDPGSTADGTRFGLHGRFSAIPATLTRASIEGERIILEAEIRQASVHGHNLLLRRSLTTTVGSDSFHLVDTVSNDGATDTAHMILYHLNIGWPLLGPTAVISTPATAVTPENDDARASTEEWSTLTEPNPEARSLVFRHHLPEAGGSGRSVVRVENPDTPIALEIDVDASTLPHLHQWKVMQPGQYVVGIEPSNSATLAGRAVAEEQGLVPVLSAGASVSYDLDFRFSTDVPLVAP
ncbi:MAG: hypothetical protein JWQ43_2977 [Glaciihabitans sp.]|nr:hypothetical protein [Glaciihabitans sp.]